VEQSRVLCLASCPVPRVFVVVIVWSEGRDGCQVGCDRAVDSRESRCLRNGAKLVGKDAEVGGLVTSAVRRTFEMMISAEGSAGKGKRAGDGDEGGR
jgi:hypothetical protein